MITLPHRNRPKRAVPRLHVTLRLVVVFTVAAGCCAGDPSAASGALRPSVTPNAHLDDGQLVTVAGPRAKALIGMWECPAGARRPEVECDQRNWTAALNGDANDFSFKFAVSSTVYTPRGANTNCVLRARACEIVEASFHSTHAGLTTDGIIARVPLTFDRQHATRYADHVFRNVNVVRNQVYGHPPAGQGQPIGLDLYEPAGDRANQRPTIVWIHGGSFQVGDKAEMAPWATDWARRGYVAVSINYRLQAKGSTILRAAQNATDDATVALAWLRSHSRRFRLDPRNLVVAGESAGGAVALNLAYHPRAGAIVPLAAISLAGSIPSTLAPKPTGVPALLFYGTKDRIVPPQLITRDCARIRRSGSACRLVAYAGVDHGLDPFLPNIDSIAARYVLAGMK